MVEPLVEPPTEMPSKQLQAERSVLDGFEEEMPLADTPAPCLLSPTPSPGRMQRTL